jgi:hypothetical protein
MPYFHKHYITEVEMISDKRKKKSEGVVCQKNA